ncbi:MAG: translation initiation factor IF-2 [candidate division Zixibacteria bacterium]|nr:translation initiation factor IF-2 [candidate division Zixibacteria bacterium]
MATKKTKQRIYDIAKEYNISSDALLKVLRGLGFTIKSHMSIASDDMLDAISEKFKKEIAEVKKDIKARKEKMQELEAIKRRKEAEKSALRKKAEVVARKKKAIAQKKAKALAAKELEDELKGKEVSAAKLEKMEAEKEAKEKAEIDKERKLKEAKAKKVNVLKIQKPKLISPAPPQEAKKVPEKQGRDANVKGKTPVKTKKGPRVTAPPTDTQATSRKKDKSKGRSQPRTGVKPPPGAVKGPDKKPRQVTLGGPRGGKKRKKRERGKKKKEHKVDTAAVKLSFKQTMATLDTGKKLKKHKKHTQASGVEDIGNAIEVTEFMAISELAKVFDKKPAELVAKCMEMGMMASINQRLDMDTIDMLALEFELEVVQIEDVVTIAIEEEEEINLQPRSPIVTIMGHVDHGKTSLLDYIRNSDVVSGESGKITQHIGAYQVNTPGGKIAFLDTPGHEAFSAMRARGAQVTDIVILVVSATEAVMPQTLEAIDHSKAAGVPIIVAINKMDLPEANPEAVRQQLANQNLMDEAWGGKTIMVEVSAKTGEGVSKLLEMVLLQAEMMELKADADIKAFGTIIEARLERGRGTVATVLIRKGTLKIGNPLVAGNFHGRVRAMIDDREKSMKQAGPSTPVMVMGISGVPLAGDSFIAVKDESEARSIAMKRQQIKREYDMRRVGIPTTLESIYEKIKDGQVTDLKIVIKGDVAGSVEALSDTLSCIGNEEVRVLIIRSGVGAITESDVLLAAASDAIVVGFHVTAVPRAREVAIKEKVDIRTYSIIYEVTEDITKAIEGLLKPEVVEKWKGYAEVRMPYKIPKVGVICGSYILQGIVARNDKIRISRDGIVLHEGTIASLKRFKDDAKEVSAGFECGIGVDSFEDIKVGDHIETYEMVETARTLE